MKEQFMNRSSALRNAVFDE